MADKFSIQEADIQLLNTTTDRAASWSDDQWFAADSAAQGALAADDLRKARLAATHDPASPRDVMVPVGYLYDLLDAISNFERSGGRDWLYARLAFEMFVISVAVWDPARRRQLARPWLRSEEAAREAEDQETA